MVSDSRDSGLTPLTPTDPTDRAARAYPGQRGEVGSDAKITARIERPGSDETPAPLPPSPAAESAARWLANHQRPAAPEPSPPVVLAPPPPIERGAPSWLFPVLLAVTMLVVGIVIGALWFGYRARACPTAPSPHGAHGSTSPTRVRLAAVSTALYTATERLAA